MTRFPSRELLVRLRAFRVRPSLKHPRLANLHVTAPGHIHSSHIQVEHSRRLFVPFVDHTLTTFSYVQLTQDFTRYFFGKHFPETTQPSIIHLSSLTILHPLLFESLSLTDVPAKFVTCVSSQQPTLHEGPSLYTQISTVSHTTTDSSNHIQASQESLNSSSSPSVCSHPTRHHIFPILHPVRLASSLRVLLVISCQFDSCVGVFGSIFASAPPHSARAGDLRSKWTGGTACTPKQCIAAA